MTDYRPMEWQVVMDGLGYSSVHETNEDGKPGDLVAHTYGDHIELIAAAPALLVALESIERYLRDTPHHNAIEAAAARKAIAKAKGE